MNICNQNNLHNYEKASDYLRGDSPDWVQVQRDYDKEYNIPPPMMWGPGMPTLENKEGIPYHLRGLTNLVLSDK